MKKSFRRLIALAISASLVITTVLASTVGVFAASKGWKLDIGGYCLGNGRAYAGEDLYCTVYNDKSSDGEAKITSVKSSNSKVVSVKKYKDLEYVEYRIFAKNKGKSTLTVKATLPDGTKKTYKKKVTVKAYPKMIKSFKLNGKAIKVNKNKNGFIYRNENFKKTSAKITIVPAKGWKISRAYGYIYKADSWRSKKLKINKKMVTGKKSISFAKKYHELDVHVQFENKKTGEVIDYNIDLMH